MHLQLRAWLVIGVFLIRYGLAGDIVVDLQTFHH